MKLVVERDVVEALAVEFPERAALLAQPRFSDRIEVGLTGLSGPEIGRLHDLVATRGGLSRGHVDQLAALARAAVAEGPRYGADDLERFAPALALWLVEGVSRGWLFRMNAAGRPRPWLVTRLDYTPPGEEESGRVVVELKANTRGKIAVENLMIRARDLADRTVAATLAALGWLKEDAGLLAAHDDRSTRYFDWRARTSAQFTARGSGIYAEDPTSARRDTDWARKQIVILSSTGQPARLVNDEDLLGDRALGVDASGMFLDKLVRRSGKADWFDMAGDKALKQARDAVAPGAFTEVPVHPLIFFFHLDLHHHVWVDVEDVEPYRYQPELKGKLVLPPEQTDLIDILTAEMDMLLEDVVAGKSGGTTVLCAGPPGVGKTLTAEVYSEIVGRPLYRVHSGQLGLDVAQMEANLEAALTRAQRWGAVMLIDEADVYIKRRRDDLRMNAVVGVFLRVLEYFDGLLFLTTNRVDDIDEAIVSRCIALIKYHMPDAAARGRIWRVMAAQFGLALDETTIARLVDQFPAISGRDIKGLAKLVAKFCAHEERPPTLEMFRRCAVFRALDVAPMEPEGAPT